MQTTMFDFGAKRARQTSSSAGSSLDCESSDVQDTDSETPVTCLGECCKPGRIDPNQPRSRDILDTTTKIINTQKRSVSAAWFDHYTWLTLCETRNVLFCHYCVEAHRQRLIMFSTKGDDAFVRNGLFSMEKCPRAVQSMKRPAHIRKL